MKISLMPIPSRKEITDALLSVRDHILPGQPRTEPLRTHGLMRVHGSEESLLTALFTLADIQVDGNRPWDIQLHDRRFFRRVMAHGTLGFGESYMEGWWDCDDLEELCFRLINARIEEHLAPHARSLVGVAFAGLVHLQERARPSLEGCGHYDIGNDFFAAMLDPAMQYSCAYFEGTNDLVLAQQLKMGLICQKLGLRPGMRILDIGCGWGGLAKYAATHYGCEVTGITLSPNQKVYAEKSCEGLPVEIRLQDYRDLSGSFDRIVSVGMLEHVGHRNYRKFLEIVQNCLHEEGRFLCHTIAANRTHTASDPWITRYIFPNSMLPSASQILQASEGLFVLEDVHNLGPHYAPTLREWERAFSLSQDQFRPKMGEEFLRMWRLYLLSCSAAFRARSLQVFQFVFSTDGPASGNIAGECRDARVPSLGALARRRSSPSERIPGQTPLDPGNGHGPTGDDEA